MAFASVTDLEARLGATVANAVQAAAFLNDATAYLQAELGQLIEAGTTTFTTRLTAGESSAVYLPQFPVRAVTAVLLDGIATTAFDLVDQRLRLRSSWWHDWQRRFLEVDSLGYSDLTVTYDYGFTVIPAELVGICCTLANQALTASKVAAAVGATGIRQEQESIDDYAHTVTYATDAPASFTLDPDTLSRLRARYGVGVYVTGA